MKSIFSALLVALAATGAGCIVPQTIKPQIPVATENIEMEKTLPKPSQPNGLTSKKPPTLSRPPQLRDLIPFNDSETGISFSYPREWGDLPITAGQNVRAKKFVTIGRPDIWPKTTYFGLTLSERNDDAFDIPKICRGDYDDGQYPDPLSAFIGCGVINGRQTIFILQDTDAYGYYVTAYQYATGTRMPFVIASSPLFDYSGLEREAMKEKWKNEIWTVLETLKP